MYDSDNPPTVTYLAAPKVVTVIGKPCTASLLLKKQHQINNALLKKSQLAEECRFHISNSSDNFPGGASHSLFLLPPDSMEAGS